MGDSDLDCRIAAVRQFNRTYTQRIGVLDEGYLDTPFSLTQGRVLYELADDDGVTAKDIAAKLALDPGYLSRMLRAFQQYGLVESKRGASDGRRKALSLTPAGRAAFAPLDRNAKTGIARMLAPLTPARQEALTGSMARIIALLDTAAEAPIALRPHRAGDIGWIVERHGALYAAEYGWNSDFEAMVAEIGAALLRDFDPRREACWIAERDGERLGSIALARRGDEVAQLRLLLVEPAARGLGLGARLVGECLDFARGAGYRRIMLETYSVLTAARRIYAAVGFGLTEEHAERAYGHDLNGRDVGNGAVPEARRLERNRGAGADHDGILEHAAADRHAGVRVQHVLRVGLQIQPAGRLVAIGRLDHGLVAGERLTPAGKGDQVGAEPAGREVELADMRGHRQPGDVVGTPREHALPIQPGRRSTGRKG